MDGTDLKPFCVNLQTFTAAYNEAGQATSFSAQVQVQSGSDVDTDRWEQRTIEVNDPLRIAGQRLYLLGHGYSPTFEITYPNGETRTYTAPFQPTDSDFTSQGVVKVTDPPGSTGDAIRRHQLAVVGIFAPSGVINDGVLSSAYPQPLDPQVAIEVYRGDLGMEGGHSQSVFAIDANQVALGLLVSQGQANLAVGESMTLDDGTKITFTGAQPWVSLQTSYDPAQGWALVSAVCLVAGLLLSLTVRRRRVWYRIGPNPASSGTPLTVPGSGSEPGGRTLIDIGGLARTDQAGYGAEFSSLVALAPVTGPRGNGKDWTSGDRGDTLAPVGPGIRGRRRRLSHRSRLPRDRLRQPPRLGDAARGARRVGDGVDGQSLRRLVGAVCRRGCEGSVRPDGCDRRRRRARAAHRAPRCCSATTPVSVPVGDPERRWATGSAWRPSSSP